MRANLRDPQTLFTFLISAALTFFILTPSILMLNFKKIQQNNYDLS